MRRWRAALGARGGASARRRPPRGGGAVARARPATRARAAARARAAKGGRLPARRGPVARTPYTGRGPRASACGAGRGAPAGAATARRGPLVAWDLGPDDLLDQPHQLGVEELRHTLL